MGQARGGQGPHRHHGLRPGAAGRRGLRRAAQGRRQGHGHEDLRRGRVGQGRLRSLRAAQRRGGRGQRGAAEEARGGERRSLRQGLDDRDQARQRQGVGRRSCRPATTRSSSPRRDTEAMRYISNTPAQQREMLAHDRRGLDRGSARADPDEGPAVAPAQRARRHGRDRSRPPPARAVGAERQRRRLRVLPGRGLLRPQRAEPDQSPDLARRVLHRLHALSARGEPGDAALHLRVPDA